MGENENSVSKQQSIQVRNVSQLNNYKDHLDNNKLSYTNSYFMVSCQKHSIGLQMVSILLK